MNSMERITILSPAYCTKTRFLNNISLLRIATGVSCLLLLIGPQTVHSFSYSTTWNSRSRSSSYIGSNSQTPALGLDVASCKYGKEYSSNYCSDNSFKTRLSHQEEARYLRIMDEYKLIQALKVEGMNQEQWAAAAKLKDSSDIDRIIFEGFEARQKLLEHNMGLVHFVVSKHYYYSSTATLGYDDLIQEGVFGLAIALDKYDIANINNNNFGTYAYHWIRATVSRAKHRSEDIIRIPEHVSLSINKIQKACERLGLDCDLKDPTSIQTSSLLRDPSREKVLAMEAGLTVHQLKEALLVANRRQSYVELEPWMMPSANFEEDYYNAVVKEKEFWAKAFGKFLRPKELEALGLRYGLWSSTSSATASDNSGRCTTSSNYSSKQAEKYPKPFRDFEAEAEEALFGKSSILFSTSASSEQQGEVPIKLNHLHKGTERKSKSAADNYFIKQGRWGEAMTFQEVARHMEISKEYGRRLCTQALSKLRQAARNGQLQPDLIML